MLRIEALTVAYGARRVLHAVSLEVEAGQVVALIGPNGSGKSTLVRAVSGVHPALSGRVRTNGDDLLSLPPSQRARRLAVVPQAVSLPPAFSVWETVLMGRTPYLNFLGQVSLRDEEIARMALQKVEALELADRRVGELSGGEQQRVALARALVGSPAVLLADEPTGNLDFRTGEMIFELLESLHRSHHLTSVLVTHNLAFARRCDRALVMEGGALVPASESHGTSQPPVHE